MTKNRICANDTGLPRHSLLIASPTAGVLFNVPVSASNMIPDVVSGSSKEMLGRIATVCEWTGAPWPELEFEDGELLLSDPFTDWHQRNGISLDLTAVGCVQSTVVFRHRITRAAWLL